MAATAATSGRRPTSCSATTPCPTEAPRSAARPDRRRVRAARRPAAGPDRHADRRAGQPPRRHRDHHRPRRPWLPAHRGDPEGGLVRDRRTGGSLSSSRATGLKPLREHAAHDALFASGDVGAAVVAEEPLRHAASRRSRTSSTTTWWRAAGSRRRPDHDAQRRGAASGSWPCRRRRAHRRCSPPPPRSASRPPLVLFGRCCSSVVRMLPVRTAKGHGALRRILGFKRFIDESREGAGPVRRAPEPLLRVPALRDRLRRHRQVGPCLRRDRRRSCPTSPAGTWATTCSTAVVFSSVDERLHDDDLGHDGLGPGADRSSGGSGFSGVGGGGFSGGGLAAEAAAAGRPGGATSPRPGAG